MSSRTGGRLPAHATGVGKVILAYSSAATVRARVEAGLPRLTPRTISTPGGLTRELRKIRSVGMALDLEESHAGVSCVAAPVFGADRRVRAGLSVTGADGVGRPGDPRPGGAHGGVHAEPRAARVRPLTSSLVESGAEVAAPVNHLSTQLGCRRPAASETWSPQRLMRGERTPPVALSPSLKKSSRWMSRGKSRLHISVFSAASTMGGGPQR